MGSLTGKGGAGRDAWRYVKRENGPPLPASSHRLFEVAVQASEIELSFPTLVQDVEAIPDIPLGANAIPQSLLAEEEADEAVVVQMLPIPTSCGREVSRRLARREGSKPGVDSPGDEADGNEDRE